MPKKNNEFLILGSIIVGLFVLLGVTNIDFSSFIIEEAVAQEPEEPQYPMKTRYSNYEETQISEFHFKQRFGLPNHIQNNNGTYVPHLLYEDSNGVQLESMYSSYYFDKNSCSMSIFEMGRIDQENQIPIYKGNLWVVKSALNGTDNWQDVTQNDLPCNVTVSNGSNYITLNATKSDNDGTITAIYHYKQYQGLKQTVNFTNNDVSMNDTHKFSFSNIILEAPRSFSIAIVETIGGNETYTFKDYSMYEPFNQPVAYGGNAIKLNTTHGETISFDRASFVFSSNTTVTQAVDGFTWVKKDKAEPNKTDYHFYDFDIGFDQLWNVKFVANSDNTLDTYIDYANTNHTLAHGESITIDPTLNFGSGDDIIRISWTHLGSNSFCGDSSSVGRDDVFGLFLTHGSGSQETCAFPVLTYDISSIPDTAAPTSGTFSLDLVAPVLNEWFLTVVDERQAFAILSENLLVLTNPDIKAAIVDSATEIIEDNAHFAIGGNTFQVQVWSQTQTSPISPFIVQFEEQLESGRDFYQLFLCPTVNPLTSGCAVGTNEVNVRTNTIQINSTSPDTFFEVEFDNFVVPQQPTNVVATFSVSPDQCFIDWEAPLDTGGRIIIGYRIERSSGGAFSTLVNDTGTAFPTNEVDLTIVSGVGFTYRISAINGEGVGAPSIPSNSCGFPEISSSPFNAVAQNVALNTVAVEWDTPTFTGNTAITGYKIERTRGSIQLVDITEATPQMFYKEHNTAGTADVTVTNQIGGAGTILTTFNSGGGIAVADRITAYMFIPNIPSDFVGKFPTSDVTVQWSGACLTGTGTMSADLEIWDGNYDGTDDSVFPQGSARVLKGNGVLQTVYTNIDPCGGGQFGTLTRSGVAIDTSNGILDTVTLVIALTNPLAGTAQLGFTTITVAGYGQWSSSVSPLTGTCAVITQTKSGTNTDEFECTTIDPPLLSFANLDGFRIIEDDTTNPLTEFIDNTVEVNTQFGYRIAAINSAGTSPFSNTAFILTSGFPPPPNSVVATETGTTTITVTWSPPDVGGATIIGYQIDRKLGVGGVFGTIQPFTNSVATVFNDQLLAAGTEYCYRLKTFTNIGVSETFSNEDCATTQDQSDPVENLLAVAVDGSQINVSWDTPLNDGGSAITGYKIERQKVAQAFFLLFAERQPESNRILNDTGREVGTLYTYRVSAITGFGQGETETTSATTDATPQAPQNFACSPASTTAINLSWTTPLSFSAPTGYQIDRKNFGDGGFSTIVADTASTATTFQDSGLTIDSVFVYRILAHTSEGDTNFTPEINCATLSAPDFPPENVQGDFSEVIPHQTILTWDIPETFGIPITAFSIERDDGAGYQQISTVSGSTATFTDQAMDNDPTQKYRIITVGSAGESAPSVVIPIDTNQTSHWHYENTLDDTGFNKNTGTVFGTANFNGTGHVGKGFIFDALTRIEIDPTQESDYDFDRLTDFGITSYYRGTPKVANDEWQLREQRFDNTTANNCRSTTKLTWDIPPVPFNQGLAGTTALGYCHLFKVFDKSDIIGKNVTISWDGFRNFSSANQVFRLLVLDGSYDRFTASDFPIDPSGDGFSNPLKGAGLLHSITRGTPNFNATDTVLMTLAGSTEPKITVDISIFDVLTTNDEVLKVFELEIEGFETWTWDSSSTVTMSVTGTPNDHGVTGASFTGASLSIEQVIVSKAQLLNSTGYKFFIDSTGKLSVKLTNTDTSDEIFVQASTVVTDDTLHFIGFGYNGNGTASGIFMNIDGSSVTPTIITDTLTGSILNNEALNLGGTSNGTSFLSGTLDETRIFGSGSLNEDQLNEVGNDELQTTAPINGTITIAGSTFANISGEIVNIQLASGFPLPTVGTITLDNFTTQQVNLVVPSIVIDPITGTFEFDRFFNIMGALSNYTADTTLTNTEEAVPILSNFDVQEPVFTFLGDFFFQQARNPDFTLLSFNFTSTNNPFSLSCNIKSELFGNGTTFTFLDVFFIQELFVVPRTTDVVVACIDPSIPPIDPTAPSFGGSNALLSFVSFGDSTGISSFLAFTDNYGDFFGASLPFLFIIILAALFTGRSAPTGIIIIGIAIGVMWFLEIITLDPIMWGVVVVLVILGALAGKKFL